MKAISTRTVKNLRECVAELDDRQFVNCVNWASVFTYLAVPKIGDKNFAEVTVCSDVFRSMRLGKPKYKKSKRRNR